MKDKLCKAMRLLSAGLYPLAARLVMPRIVSLIMLILIGISLERALAAGRPYLWVLYQKHDFFSLRRLLPPPSTDDRPEIVFLQGETQAAFGQYAESTARLRSLLDSASPSLAALARRRVSLNSRALFRYREALAMNSDGLPGETVRLLRSLKDVQPQIAARPSGIVELARDRFGQVAGAINALGVHLVFDTGANLSAVTRSVARTAGLRIVLKDHPVRSPTGAAVMADIAVGTLSLGSGTTFTNVVLVVLPDQSLRFSHQSGTDGIVGLPVLSQLGAVGFLPGGRIVLRAGGPAKAEPIALIDGDPVIELSLDSRRLLCRLDSGANRTTFLASYGRHFAADRGAPPHAARVRTVRGLERIASARLSPLVLRLANRVFPIAAPLLVRGPRHTAFDCSLGRDALQALEPYTLDLQRMRFAAN